METYFDTQTKMFSWIPKNFYKIWARIDIDKIDDAQRVEETWFGRSNIKHDISDQRIDRMDKKMMTDSVKSF